MWSRGIRGWARNLANTQSRLRIIGKTQDDLGRSAIRETPDENCDVARLRFPEYPSGDSRAAGTRRLRNPPAMEHAAAAVGSMRQSADDAALKVADDRLAGLPGGYAIWRSRR